MIHVCSLARLHETVDETGARHVVSLSGDEVRLERPAAHRAGKSSLAAAARISAPLDGYIVPGEAARRRSARFRPRAGTAARRWWCIASPASAARPRARSPASARSIRIATKTSIAQALRPPRRQRRRISVSSSLADRLLGRDGRMVAAIETIGRGVMAAEGDAVPARSRVMERYSASEGRSTGRVLATGSPPASPARLHRRQRPARRTRRRRRRIASRPRALVSCGARIALIEIAIGKAQAGDRAAEAAIVDLLHPKARLDRHAGQMRAHRAAVDPDGAGRQSGEAHLALAARPDGADDGAIGKDAARRRRCRRSRYR